MSTHVYSSFSVFDSNDVSHSYLHRKLRFLKQFKFVVTILQLLLDLNIFVILLLLLLLFVLSLTSLMFVVTILWLFVVHFVELLLRFVLPLMSLIPRYLQQLKRANTIRPSWELFPIRKRW